MKRIFFCLLLHGACYAQPMDTIPMPLTTMYEGNDSVLYGGGGAIAFLIDSQMYLTGSSDSGVNIKFTATGVGSGNVYFKENLGDSIIFK